MSLDLSLKKCFNHAAREAAARCLDCKNFFCAECITEHDGRLTCSNCLTKKADVKKESKPLPILKILAPFVILISITLTIIFFTLFSRVLYNSPEDYHILSSDYKTEEFKSNEPESPAEGGL